MREHGSSRPASLHQRLRGDCTGTGYETGNDSQSRLTSAARQTAAGVRRDAEHHAAKEDTDADDSLHAIGSRTIGKVANQQRQGRADANLDRANDRWFNEFERLGKRPET